MDLNCRPDAQMLEGACVAYEAAVEAYETVQKQGRLVAKRILDPKTNELVVVSVKSHPAVAQGNAAWEGLLQRVRVKSRVTNTACH